MAMQPEAPTPALPTRPHGTSFLNPFLAPGALWSPLPGDATGIPCALSGSLPLSVARVGSLPLSVARVGSLPLSVARVGSLPLSVARVGSLPLSVARVGFEAPQPLSRGRSWSRALSLGAMQPPHGFYPPAHPRSTRPMGPGQPPPPPVPPGTPLGYHGPRPQAFPPYQAMAPFPAQGGTVCAGMALGCPRQALGMGMGTLPSRPRRTGPCWGTWKGTREGRSWRTRASLAPQGPWAVAPPPDGWGRGRRRRGLPWGPGPAPGPGPGPGSFRGGSHGGPRSAGVVGGAGGAVQGRGERRALGAGARRGGRLPRLRRTRRASTPAWQVETHWQVAHPPPAAPCPPAACPMEGLWRLLRLPALRARVPRGGHPAGAPAHPRGLC